MFKFYLQKYKRSKTIVLQAKDTKDAYSKIAEKYPLWEVSMFWPVWEGV